MFGNLENCLLSSGGLVQSSRGLARLAAGFLFKAHLDNCCVIAWL